MGIACVTSLNQLGHGKKRQPLRFKFIIDRRQMAKTCKDCGVTQHGRPKECKLCGSLNLVNARDVQ